MVWIASKIVISEHPSMAIIHKSSSAEGLYVESVEITNTGTVKIHVEISIGFIRVLYNEFEKTRPTFPVSTLKYLKKLFTPYFM
jgi:hypothetical protein